MRTHLSHALPIFTTHVCFMANFMPLNLTLFLTVQFSAMHGYTATHMCITHVMVLFHSATTMQLPYIYCSYLDMPLADSINRFSTNMYI